MRKLQTDDMFLLSEIMDKMDIEIEVKGKEQAEVGAAMLMQIVKKAYKAKAEIRELIAAITGKSAEEVAKMPISETINTVKELLKQDGVLDFLQQ